MTLDQYARIGEIVAAMARIGQAAKMCVGSQWKLLLGFTLGNLLRRVPIMTKSIFFSIAVVAIITIVAPTFAGEIGVDVVITDGEASINRAYYRDQAAPRNGKKKDHRGLPPGIAKNLQRGKSLPPGIAKQALPASLNDLLRPPPDGFERIVLSGKVLLVEIATQVIHDVLDDMILGK
jgi:hypothetical protein